MTSKESGQRSGMLAVTVDTEKLDYDIHSLVKAFYQEEEVKVLSPSTDREKVNDLKKYLFMEIILKGGLQKIVFYAKDPEGIPQSEREFSFSVENLFKDGETLSKEGKHLFKSRLYQSLSEYTGRSLPWGNLTGIRPTKIAMGMLSSGKDDEEIVRFMEEAHFVSRKKAKLSVEIARRERKILKPLHGEEGYSIYIGIPFCPTTCLYCSFTSYPICAYEDVVDRYIECLCREMDHVAEAYRGKTLDSIYIGGGTPTTLSPSCLDRLLSHLDKTFDLSEILEFTVEAGRADSITREKLSVLKDHEVSRISINPQTMKEETLKLIGRRHTAEQVKEAFFLARDMGFDNINMDMILGLPGENEEDVAKTVSEIEKLDPDSLTVHSLAVKRASRLREWTRENGSGNLYPLGDVCDPEETMAAAAKGAEAMNMHPYYLYRQKNMTGNLENVGYAREGKYGIYNILIMEEVQTIMALGAGSISKVLLPGGRIERADNVKDVRLYIEKFDEMLKRKDALFQLQKDEGWLGKL